MISLKEELARNFLARYGIENYEIKKIAGDASFRSYYRIFYGGKTHILMFAPPGYEDIRPFVRIDKFLVSHNFSAPKIFAVDEENGFLLLEDLGDDTYGKVLSKDNSSELQLYKKACDVLLALHRFAPPSNILTYNNALLFREVMLFVDWYLPLCKQSMNLQDRARFKFLWFQLFDFLTKENQVLVLRDYHADNLMVLLDRNEFQSVGLLDFQDAVVGVRAYDLVSLLEDARRDVNIKNRQEIFNYYLLNSCCDEESFSRDYEILSLQRNIKIIGIFSRLSLRDGKHNYLKLVPRVIEFIELRLNSQNKIFSEMKIFLKKFLSHEQKN